MSAAHPICLLWDASHIWGLMAWRAVRALGLPCRLVKGREIAEGAFLGKRTGTALLLVPGGSARLKAQALGAKGREAVRRWVAEGGRYLGFCGGAGLALTHADPAHGLGLCPWQRAGYSQRLHHLVSGHVRAHCEGGAPAPGLPAAPALPVWWPGRFAPTPDPRVRTLASYGRPGDDFWLADLPLRLVPRHILEGWQAVYGVDLSADFLEDQPMIVSGQYGRGQYILSYSHLETPHSPDANAWLAHVLQSAGLEPAGCRVPLWQLRSPRAAWPDGPGAPLLHGLERVRALLDLAVEHRLFFARTHWLWGWRSGLPGAACNNLYAALCTAAALPPSAKALDWWEETRARFEPLMRLFAASAEDYLLACRLADTLAPIVPDAVGRRGLDHRRQEIFGHPMTGGGLVNQLLHMAEELIYLSQENTPCDLLPHNCDPPCAHQTPGDLQTQKPKFSHLRES